MEIVALLECRKLNSQGSGLTAADVPEQANPVIVGGVANAVAVNAPMAAVAQPKLRRNPVPEIHQMTAKQMIRQYQELLVTTDVLDAEDDAAMHREEVIRRMANMTLILIASRAIATQIVIRLG